MDGANGGGQPFPYWLVMFDGTRLRKHRRDRDLSQERLAHRSRVSLGTIQRVEKLALATCHFGTLQRLARALSTDPDALISQLTADIGSALAAPARKPPLHHGQTRGGGSLMDDDTAIRLAEEFGVCHVTMRHALVVLRQRRLIISVRGRGAFTAPGSAGNAS